MAEEANTTTTTIALAVTSPRHLSDAQKAKLRKATREFESLFVQMMLKSMRSAQEIGAGGEGSEGAGEFGGEDYGGDVMKAMFDTELSRKIGQQGSLGIAQTLYRKLTGEALTQEPSPQSSASVAAAMDRRERPAPHTAAARTAGAAAAAVQQSGQAADNTSTQAQAAPKAAPVLQKQAEKAEKSALPLPPAVQRGAPQAVAMMASAAILAPAQRDATQTAAQVSQATVTATGGVLTRLGAYEKIITHAADTVGVDANLLKAMIVEESGGRAQARSSRNAKGLMQLIDTTARSMGVTNVWDPHQNIEGGARYLKQQLERFNGNVSLALASYNAGPGAVERYHGIPPFQQTRNYVKRVMKHFAAFQSLENRNNDVIE